MRLHNFIATTKTDSCPETESIAKPTKIARPKTDKIFPPRAIIRHNHGVNRHTSLQFSVRATIQSTRVKGMRMLMMMMLMIGDADVDVMEMIDDDDDDEI